MHHELYRVAVDHVALDLGGVVADVVHDAEPERMRIPAEHLPHHLTDAVRDDLPVREGRVGGGIHGAKVRLAFGRAKRRARQLAVANRDAIGAHRVSNLRR